jgi:hypothetical protein
MGPPLLTAEQKQIRILMAIELLQVLSVQNTRQWHEIVTLDELWIYCCHWCFSSATTLTNMSAYLGIRISDITSK